jgi:urease accessory protein
MVETLECVTAPVCDVSLRAGAGALAIAHSGVRSVVTRARAASPLRLLMPKNDGTAAWVYTSTFGGGLVGGDCIDLEVDIGAGAACFLSTQASTKVYRSRSGAESRVSARVASGGFLAMVPDPVVCFRASRFRQLQRVDLAGDAGLVFVDWVTSGRRAAGERWAFHEYTTCFQVRVDDRLLVHDAVMLRAADIDVAERMGRFDVLALVVMMGPRVREAAKALVERIGASPLGRRADQITSAAAVGDGCVMRVAGVSVEEVARTVREWCACVPRELGDDPWSRKW